MSPAVELGMAALLSSLLSQQAIELLCSLIWYLISQLSLIVTVLSAVSLCLLPSEKKGWLR